MALAHAVSDKVEAAYRRGEAWAKFCAAAPDADKIVPIRMLYRL